MQRLWFSYDNSLPGADVAETASPADSVTVAINYGVTVAESASAADTTNAIVGSTTIAESVSAADTASAQLIAALAIAEAASAAETISAAIPAGTPVLPSPFYDRVRETTSTTGTGTVSLGGAVTGFRNFTIIADGAGVYYTISDQAGANWEVGYGIYHSGARTISRQRVYASSNSGALVNFGAGAKDVFLTGPSAVLSPREWNVKADFGAVGDARRVYDGVINSGSTTFTSATAAFTAADVGKQIGIWGAGAGGTNLLTTVASINSGSSIELASAAQAALSGRHAVIGTDDTAAFQNAINAAHLVRGIYPIFVPGGQYFIAGPLQDTSTNNAQIKFPNFADTNAPYTLEIFGATHESALPWAWPPHNYGTVLHSMAWRTTDGWTGAAVFGGGNQGGGNMPGSAVNVRMRRLTITTYPDPHVGAINAQNVSGLWLEDVNAQTGQYDAFGSIQPTDTGNIGIAWPRTNCPCIQHSQNTIAEGYYTGFRIYEHFIGQDKLYAFCCYNGIEIMGTWHGSNIQELHTTYCVNGILGTPTAQSQHKIFIGIHDIEMRSQGGYWFSTGYELNDPSNVVSGQLYYHVIQGGVGYSNTYRTNGGTAITKTKL